MHASRRAECLVVGAGPAGLTAALYLRRFEREVVVADHGHSRALAIERTRNYPGFPDGVSGHGLLSRLREQLAAVQGGIIAEEITALQRHPSGGFTAHAGENALWHAQTVLLATGVVDGVPALAGIEELQQRGLLRQCPVCDGFEHRGQRILVLGDGPHAAREAAFIARFSRQVSRACLIEGPDEHPDKGTSAFPRPVRGAWPGDEHGPRESRVRLLPARAARVEALPESGVRLHLADGSAHDFDVTYAALGVTPRSALGQGLGAAVDAEGCLIVDTHGATDVFGLFAAGDVVRGLDQLVVAAARGAVAATAIHNLLREAGD